MWILGLGSQGVSDLMWSSGDSTCSGQPGDQLSWGHPGTTHTNHRGSLMEEVTPLECRSITSGEKLWFARTTFTRAAPSGLTLF